MRSIDHDGRTELATDRSGRGFGGICRPEDVTDFPDGFDTFVDDRNALFGARLVHGGFVAVSWTTAGHETDDVVELIVTVEGAENLAELLRFVGTDLKTEFLFKGNLGLGSDDVCETRAEDFLDRSIELDCLGDAHPMNFDSDDVKSRAREEVDNVTGTTGGESEIVRFDQHKGALWNFAGLINDRIVDNAAIRIGKAGPKFGFGLSFLGVWGGENGRLEISDVVIFVENEVPIGIADGFSTAAVRIDVPDDGADFPDSVFSFEKEHHGASRFLGFRVGG